MTQFDQILLHSEIFISSQLNSSTIFILIKLIFISLPDRTYTSTIPSSEILRRLALHGLVHCDFNEFNLMVDQSGQVTLIDFPQVG